MLESSENYTQQVIKTGGKEQTQFGALESNKGHISKDAKMTSKKLF